MKKIFYKDGSYNTCADDHAWEYENTPDWSHTEDTTEEKEKAWDAHSEKCMAPRPIQEVSRYHFDAGIEAGIAIERKRMEMIDHPRTIIMKQIKYFIWRLISVPTVIAWVIFGVLFKFMCKTGVKLGFKMNDHHCMVWNFNGVRAIYNLERKSWKKQ